MIAVNGLCESQEICNILQAIQKIAENLLDF